MKKNIRENFKTKTKLKDRYNPVHSTDNEAEAIGHLQYFFSNQEKELIINKINKIRYPNEIS